MTKTSKEQLARGIKEGYRSGLEEGVGKQLTLSGLDWTYESERIPYIAKPKTYTPDFIIKSKDSSKVYIETKGRFIGADRAKHLLIKKQHPELDIRFVFTNPNQKLNKGSKTSYADWCIKYGFSYARKEIPESWIKLLS
tara:strand:+ start:1973 stop:2389 length:417 start_codon:yes stop_codon:yes gene_type:complete